MLTAAGGGISTLDAGDDHFSDRACPLTRVTVKPA
jgi:hypothetical protein